MKKYHRIIMALLVATHFHVAVAESNVKQVITTKSAPKAAGPYSQAIKVANTLYLSGQIAIDPKTGVMNQGTIEQQTTQVLENIKAVLKASGYSLADVVQSQVYLTDINNYKAMNSVYAKYFKQKPSARAVAEVSKLPKNGLVEIMVTAIK